jgi:hypothetical protein
MCPVRTGAQANIGSTRQKTPHISHRGNALRLFLGTSLFALTVDSSPITLHVNS